MDLHDSAAASGGRDRSREYGSREYGAALDAASARARAWLGGVFDRPIPARRSIDEVKTALGRTLPERGSDPAEVIERLADGVEPGLMASQSARFYGWVMGGTFPVALAADWLVSSWDQNAGMRDATPGVVGAEELAGDWLLELLGLPATADVGFVTGATAANFVGLSAARQQVLRGTRLGRESAPDSPAPRRSPSSSAASGTARSTSPRAISDWGSRPPSSPTREGRIIVEALAEALESDHRARRSSACRPATSTPEPSTTSLARCAIAHDARGLGACRRRIRALGRRLARGSATSPPASSGADSWASDAHKTLNVPVRLRHRDRRESGCHACRVRHARAATCRIRTRPSRTTRCPSSRAAPTAFRSGRRCAGSDATASPPSSTASPRVRRPSPPGSPSCRASTILNDVVYTQVEHGHGRRRADARTRSRGCSRAARCSPRRPRWHDRAVLRFSVSNWATDAAEAARTVDAVRRALPARLAPRLVDRAGALLARALADRVGDRGRLAERQLQRTQSVAQAPRVHVADLGGGCRDQAGEGGDELARLVEVDLGLGVVGEPAP